MQPIKQNTSQNATQVSTEKRDSHKDKSNIYTLENLIQTLEEVANHLTRK
ncbi:serine dehydratase [Sphaerospermopsis aphanizomenoides BCCUSP55]|nr:serine dehydratase [Sphaerospermopsis aphanizomenoides BCCUSP55]